MAATQSADDKVVQVQTRISQIRTFGIHIVQDLLTATKKKMQEICKADCPVLTRLRICLDNFKLPSEISSSWPTRGVIEPEQVKQTVGGEDTDCHFIS